MSDQPALVDENVVAELRESVGWDDAFIKDLVATYLTESPGYLDAMATAAAAGDAAAAVRPAHTLKSSSAALGAMRLSAVSKQVELAAREGRVDAAGIADAQSLWPQTVAALTEAGLSD